MTTDLERIERLKHAFARVLGKKVEVVPRREWQELLRPGGKPTLMPEPLGPHLGTQGAPGYQAAIASGAPHAEPGGAHYYREDETAPPDQRKKLYSHIVIEDVTADKRWPEALRIAGLEPSEDVVRVARDHVFTYLELRDDHHRAELSDDIASAKPKEVGE